MPASNVEPEESKGRRWICMPSDTLMYLLGYGFVHGCSLGLGCGLPCLLPLAEGIAFMKAAHITPRPRTSKRESESALFPLSCYVVVPCGACAE